jgi:hypothetical protein
LITADPNAGKPAAAVEWNPPQSEINAESCAFDGSIGLESCSRFLRAVVYAWSTLRLLPIERIIMRVRERNAAIDRGAGAVSQQTLSSAISVFVKMRPFVFAAQDACLFECLVLSEFLAHTGILPNWIFAVQFEPFRAHCWLQLDSIVLNDSVENVTRFCPIMII